MQAKFEIGWSGEELPGQRLEDAEGAVFVDVAIWGKTMHNPKNREDKGHRGSDPCSLRRNQREAKMSEPEGEVDETGMNRHGARARAEGGSWIRDIKRIM